MKRRFRLPVRKTNKKIRSIWLSVLILFICVCTSIVVVANKIQTFLMDDAGAISLIPARSPSSSENTVSDGQDKYTGAFPPSEETLSHPADTQHEVTSPPPAASQEAQPSHSAGFAVSDENTVWTTDTEVEIFRVSYVNGEQVITVNSDNGEEVIAPGTENSYTFKLKNTGDTPLDYTVSVDAYFTPEDIVIPITGRISRYDGEWIAGGKNEYVKAEALDQTRDSASLGAGRYTYYTLDWRWPYESGDDGLDTMLGNMATKGDLVFTIVITTTAKINADSNTNGGLQPPQTGDISNIALWSVIAAISFAVTVGLIILIKRKETHSEPMNENGR